MEQLLSKKIKLIGNDKLTPEIALAIAEEHHKEYTVAYFRHLKTVVHISYRKRPTATYIQDQKLAYQLCGRTSRYDRMRAVLDQNYDEMGYYLIQDGGHYGIAFFHGIAKPKTWYRLKRTEIQQLQAAVA